MKRIFIIIFSAVLLIGCQSKEVKKAKEFIDAQMFKEAISLLEIEIQDNPKNAEANYLLGQCLIKLGSEKKAKEYFKRVILLDTDYKEKIGEYFYGEAIKLLKEDDGGAEYYYEMGLEYDPVGKEKFVKELFEMSKEQAETATDAYDIIDLFETVLELDKRYYEEIASICMTNAKNFVEKDFIVDGFKLGEFSIEQDPKYIKELATLYFDYGKKLFIDIDKPEEGERYLNRAAELEPDFKERISDLFFEYGKKYININNESKMAVNYLDKSTTLDPKNIKTVAKIYYDLAKRYEETEEVFGELTFALKASTLDKTYLDYYKEKEAKYKQGTFVDKRDGQEYKWVRIGKQSWMAENLAYRPSSGNYWAYDNNTSNVAVYGYLYDWETARNVCPDGWHLPSDSEWKELEMYLGMSQADADDTGLRGTDEGSQLAGNSALWTAGALENAPAFGSSGFTALPGGFRSYNGTFHLIGGNGYCWSATEDGTNDAWTRGLDYDYSNVIRGSSYKQPGGFSVRCLRD